MLKEKLIELLTQATDKAQQLGKLPSITLPEVTIEHPQNTEHGDYATSLPLKLARATSTNPMTIAGDIINLIEATPEIESVVAAPPGFINFTLKNMLANTDREGVPGCVVQASERVCPWYLGFFT